MAPEPSKHFFKNLDALRFLSFFAVFLSHAFFLAHNDAGSGFISEFSRISHLGRLGVDFFFVLSSFLITWIILEEWGSTGNFKIGYFYIRRVLRIWPLYFLIVFAALIAVLVQQAGGLTVSHIPPAIYLFTFTLNFYVSQYGPHFLFFLVFLWSIAVEEQFYLVWACFLKFFRKYLAAFCWVLLVLSVVFRWYFFPGSNKLYFHTLSVLSDFAIGALFSQAAFQKKNLLKWVEQAPRMAWFALYLCLLLSVVFYDALFSGHLSVSLERTWFALLFALVILEQSYARHSPVKFGKWKSLSYLGKRSYGLYCYHGIMLTLASKILAGQPAGPGFISMLVVPVVLFLFTTFVASVSYRFFEKPFLQIRQRYY